MKKNLQKNSNNVENIKRYDNIIKKLSGIKESDFNQFFDNVNLIKLKFLRELCLVHIGQILNMKKRLVKY